MASIIAGYQVGQRLVEALGLGGRKVREITLRVAVDECVTARWTEWLTADRRASVEAAENVTSEQFDAAVEAVRDVTALGCEFRESAAAREAGGEGSLDGPAERLARAVLAGDVKAALVLADLVQELWAGR